MELLLTLVLILCLAAASVFSYTALHRSANLDEGANRLQSLIRFAQAEAATSGRKVRLEFQPMANESNSASSDSPEKTELRQIKVTWEADFLHQPGVFQECTNKAWSEETVNELVGVTRVQPIQSPYAPSKPSQDSTAVSDSSTQTLKEEGQADQVPADSFPAITFYPDGSCDSAEIVLASRNSEDERLMAVRLSGILGSVSSHPVSSDAESSSEEVESSDNQSPESTSTSDLPENNFAETE